MIKRKIKQSLFWMTAMICFSFCVQSVYGQSMQTGIDKKAILIGEQINYTLQFTLPTANYRIEFNVPDSFEHFEILDKVKSDSSNSQGNYLVIQNIRLTSWDSGQWSIPSFPIKIRNTADNAEYTLNTDKVLINVGYAPADSTNELRDIKPIMKVFYIDRTWIYIAAAVLVLIVLLALLYRYVQKRPARQKPLFQAKLSPFQEAMQSLDSLSGINLSAADQVKMYHTSLADIFKRYYSRRRQSNLLNKTTGEILLMLKEMNIDPQNLSTIAEALRLGDAVKFAKYIPPVYESEKNMENIKTAITNLEKLDL